MRTRKKKIQCIPGTEEMVNMKGNRPMLQCTCANCGILKHNFVKQGGLLDIHKLIGKLPKPKGGFTLPSHKYTGQYNPLEKVASYANDQHLPGQEPYNQIDAIALKHDICYRDNNNERGKLKCDKDMLNFFFFFRLLPTRGRHSAIVISISLGLLHLLP